MQSKKIRNITFLLLLTFIAINIGIKKFLIEPKITKEKNLLISQKSLLEKRKNKINKYQLELNKLKTEEDFKNLLKSNSKEIENLKVQLNEAKVFVESPNQIKGSTSQLEVKSIVLEIAKENNVTIKNIIIKKNENINRDEISILTESTYIKNIFNFYLGLIKNKNIILLIKSLKLDSTRVHYYNFIVDAIL